MVRALDRKLLRDLWSMRGQAIAIGLVVACGVATFVMSLTTLESLQVTQDTYYDRYRFAHVFAHLKRGPITLASRIAEIPGVGQVQTRIVRDVNLDVPGLAEPAIGRLISVPDMRTPGLNDLHLRSGRYLEPGSRGEVIASEAFADTHGFKPGAQVRAIINGRRQDLTIVGIALSPEYIFQIRPGEILPDDRRFGIFWMGHTELAAAFNMEGAFNDVTLGLMRGASEPDAIQRLDELLEPYGGIGAYGRSDQLSHKYISSEIEQLRGMGIVAPSIFLAVAAFLLNVVLSRMISTQREQIAALKAFGYTRAEIGMHYFKFVLLIVAGGVVLGTAVGLWLAHGLTQLYTQFYKFPVFFFRIDPGVTVLALLISSAAAILGTVTAVRRAVLLPPAEAMRPEPPANYRPTLVERLGLGWLFSASGRMILRNLERQPVKAVFSVLGISLAVSVLVLGNFSADAIDYLMEFQFSLSERQDVTVAFVEPTSGTVLYAIGQLPGVLHAEPFRSVPVRMRAGHRSRRLGVMGLEPGASLFRLLDEQARPVVLPRDGLVLSEALSEVLRVRVGDEITLEVLEGERPVRRVHVAGLVADLSGLNAYMNLETLNRVMHEGPTVFGAYVSVDQERIDDLYAELKNTPRVAGVSIKEAALRSFEETVAENMLRMQMFYVVFAGIIAFGVVYNTARVSLSERSRELATLRVLGFTRMEISAILLGELAVLTLAAIPVGFVFGYGFASLMTQTVDTEMFRIPLVIGPATYGYAAAVTIVAALCSGLVVRRMLDRLDLVAVLKARD